MTPNFVEDPFTITLNNKCKGTYNILPDYATNVAATTLYAYVGSTMTKNLFADSTLMNSGTLGVPSADCKFRSSALKVKNASGTYVASPDSYWNSVISSVTYATHTNGVVHTAITIIPSSATFGTETADKELTF